MNAESIASMRKKQFLMVNLITLILMTLYVLFTAYVGTSYFMFAVGAIVMIQSFIDFFKKDSATSWIPIIEQVARYEKAIMGKEWIRQHKLSQVIGFIVGGVLILQGYLSPNLGGTHSISIWFYVILTVLILVAFNITLFIHSRKVDNSNTTADFKGYTAKTTIIGFIMGIVIAVISIIVIFIYVLTKL